MIIILIVALVLGVIYWAIKDYWKEWTGMYDINTEVNYGR
jgi:hypothetical protein